MSNFNLENYETVKERKARFYEDHKDGRIVVSLLNAENPLDYALFVAKVYLTADDQKNDTPKATGYALEVRDKELSISSYGKEYESVNYSSWTENCEESAVGRALDNAGYSGNKKPSRDEMVKAQNMNQTMRKVNEASKPVLDNLKSKCLVHNVDMVQKISSKTNKPYFSHKLQDGSLCFGK